MDEEQNAEHRDEHRAVAPAVPRRDRRKYLLPQEHTDRVLEACRVGVSETQIARALRINYRTWMRVREEDERVASALSKAKKFEEEELVAMLMDKARRATPNPSSSRSRGGEIVGTSSSAKRSSAARSSHAHAKCQGREITPEQSLARAREVPGPRDHA